MTQPKFKLGDTVFAVINNSKYIPCSVCGIQLVDNNFVYSVTNDAIAPFSRKESDLAYSLDDFYMKEKAQEEEAHKERLQKLTEKFADLKKEAEELKKKQNEQPRDEKGKFTTKNANYSAWKNSSFDSSDILESFIDLLKKVNM